MRKKMLEVFQKAIQEMERERLRKNPFIGTGAALLLGYKIGRALRELGGREKKAKRSKRAKLEKQMWNVASDIFLSKLKQLINQLKSKGNIDAIVNEINATLSKLEEDAKNITDNRIKDQLISLIGEARGIVPQITEQLKEPKTEQEAQQTNGQNVVNQLLNLVQRIENIYNTITQGATAQQREGTALLIMKSALNKLMRKENSQDDERKKVLAYIFAINKIINEITEGSSETNGNKKEKEPENQA